MGACGRGATDSTPPLPLTTVTRLDLGLAVDTVLVGDSLSAAVRGFNREGTVLPLSVVVSRAAADDRSARKDSAMTNTEIPDAANTPEHYPRPLVEERCRSRTVPLGAPPPRSPQKVRRGGP